MKTLINEINNFAVAVATDIKGLQNGFTVKHEELTAEFAYYSDGTKIVRFCREPFKKQTANGQWENRYTLVYEDA